MARYLQLVGLTVTVMLALVMFASAISGIVRGRVKIEPHQRWVVFRENPVRFVGYILWYLCFAFGFSLGAARLVVSWLR
jgi:hypothetical protein